MSCEGDPVRISVCHCLACQRRTGSAFGVQARFALDRVTIEGEATRYVRIADSGGRVSFRFCAACGATVCWELEALRGFMQVAVGAFADPTFPSPTVAIYDVRRHPWVTLPEQVESLD